MKKSLADPSVAQDRCKTSQNQLKTLQNRGFKPLKGGSEDTTREFFNTLGPSRKLGNTSPRCKLLGRHGGIRLAPSLLRFLGV